MDPALKGIGAIDALLNELNAMPDEAETTESPPTLKPTQLHVVRNGDDFETTGDVELDALLRPSVLECQPTKSESASPVTPPSSINGADRLSTQGPCRIVPITTAGSTREPPGPTSDTWTSGDPELDALLLAGQQQSIADSLPNQTAPGGASSVAVECQEQPAQYSAKADTKIAGQVKTDSQLAPSSLGLVTAPSVYHFPFEERAYIDELARVRDLPPVELLGLVEELTGLLDAVTGQPVPYADVRALFCARSIALNMHGVYPPGIRQTRRPRKAQGKSISESDSALSNDRQVIDLHYLALHGHPSPNAEFRSLVNPETFLHGVGRLLARKSACSLAHSTNKERN